MSRRRATVEAAVYLAMAGIVTFFLLPELLVPFVGRDESTYAYFAAHASRHYILYRDFWDVHFPGLYYIYAAAFQLSPDGMIGVRVTRWIFGLLGAIAFYTLLRRLTTPTLARIGGIVYAICSVSRALEGDGALGESFMLPPLVVAMTLFLQGDYISDFLAGVAVGVAAVMKQNALLLGAYPLLDGLVGGMARARRSVARTAATGVGVCVPVIGAAAALGASGALPDFYRCTVKDVLGYRYQSVGVTQGIGFCRHLAMVLLRGHPFLVLAPLAGVLVLFARRADATPEGRSLRSSGVFFVLWLVIAAGMILGGVRGIPHYLLLVVPPLCGLAMLALHEAWRRRAAWHGKAILCILAGLLVFDAGRAVRGGILALRENSPFERKPFWWSEVKVGDYIREHTTPDESIFVWGPKPAVYHFAQRSAPTRQVILMAIVGPNRNTEPPRRPVPGMMEELLRDLTRDPPAYVVAVQTLRCYNLSAPQFAPISSFLRDGYALDRVMGEYQLYRRIGISL